MIRPGLTGWAQVRQGYANGLEEETEKMRYDLYYIKHMSAWLDLRILVRTVKTVLCGRESIPKQRHSSGVITAVGGELQWARAENADRTPRPARPGANPRRGSRRPRISSPRKRLGAATNVDESPGRDLRQRRSSRMVAGHAAHRSQTAACRSWR